MKEIAAHVACACAAALHALPDLAFHTPRSAGGGALWRRDRRPVRRAQPRGRCRRQGRRRRCWQGRQGGTRLLDVQGGDASAPARPRRRPRPPDRHPRRAAGIRRRGRAAHVARPVEPLQVRCPRSALRQGPPRRRPCLRQLAPCRPRLAARLTPRPHAPRRAARTRRAQRRTLIRHWVSLQLDNIVSEVQRLAGLYGRVQEEMAATRQTADARLLRGAAVVGMTTSGVASLQNLIGAVGPKVRAQRCGRPAAEPCCCSCCVCTRSATRQPPGRRRPPGCNAGCNARAPPPRRSWSWRRRPRCWRRTCWPGWRPPRSSSSSSGTTCSCAPRSRCPPPKLENSLACTAGF